MDDVKETLGILGIVIVVFVVIFAALLYTEIPGTIDGFEDGDYTDNPTWNVYIGDATVQRTVVKNGTYALRLDDTPSTKSVGSIAKTERGPIDSVYAIWINTTNANNASHFQIEAGGKLAQRIRIVGHKFTAYDGGSATTFDATAMPDTWYKFEIVYQDNSNSSLVSIYDRRGKLIEAKTLKPYSPGIVDSISVATDTTTYFDSGPTNALDVIVNLVTGLW